MSLLGAFCAATVLSAVVLAYYYAQAWHVTKQRLVEAVGIVQGKPPEAFVDKPKPTKANTNDDSEQPSYTQMQEAWALKTRDLELREQSLRGEKERMQRDRLSVTDDKKKLGDLYKTFVAKIDDVDKGERAKGREQVRATLESIKPKQAKVFLSQMLEKNEIDDVVLILSAMPEGKQAKIIAEFTTKEEAEQIGNVLRLIRSGQPKTQMSDEAKKKLQSSPGTGS